MLKSIRTRIVLAFLTLSLITALPVSWLFYDALRNVFSISFDMDTKSALSDAVSLSRELLDGHKSRCLERTRAIAESPFLVDFQRRLARGILSRTQLDTLFGSLDPRKRSFNAVVLMDQKKVIHFRGIHEVNESDIDKTLLDSLFLQTVFSSSSAVVEYEESYGLVRAASPLSRSSELEYRILTAWKIPRDLETRLTRTLRAFRIHQNLQTQKETLIRSFLTSFLIVYGAIFLLSLLIALAISARLTRPINTLVRATEVIARGDLDYRIPLDAKNDEVGKLVISFNGMIDRIKQHQDRLIYLEKVTAWREIAQRMAHEIKNPLTPIQLNIQQLKDSYRGPDQEYRALLETCHEIITEEIENLRNLTREFSDFARLPQISMQFGDINELAADVARLYPEVHVVLGSDVHSFEFDREGLKRVLINLVDNARTATSGKENGFVRIGTSQIKNHVHIAVSDNGRGIAKPDLPRIFEPHFSGKSTGMGLGLAISKAIIDEHQGAIEVESIERHGTTFRIVIPMYHDIVNRESAT